MFWETFGIWLAAALTLGIVSFLYKDNIYYKICEAIFVGSSAGYWFVTYFWDNLYKKFYTNAIINGEEELIEVGYLIFRKLGLQALVITRGEHGMTLFQRNGRPEDQIDVTHIPAVAREVFDVTGAGDTVDAVLTLSLASGADITQAVKISNYAAGIVVGEVGTACVTPKELLSIIDQHENASDV